MKETALSDACGVRLLRLNVDKEIQKTKPLTLALHTPA